MIGRQQGPDEGNGPAAQFIHDRNFWAVAGAAITSRWDTDAGVHLWGIHFKKWDNQDLRYGHQTQLELIEKCWPSSRVMVIWFNSKTDQPTHIWHPGIKGGVRRPITPDQYYQVLNKYGTPKIDNRDMDWS
jgi:hypothetical protein